MQVPAQWRHAKCEVGVRRADVDYRTKACSTVIHIQASGYHSIIWNAFATAETLTLLQLWLASSAAAVNTVRQHSFASC